MIIAKANEMADPGIKWMASYGWKYDLASGSKDGEQLLVSWYVGLQF